MELLKLQKPVKPAETTETEELQKLQPPKAKGQAMRCHFGNSSWPPAGDIGKLHWLEAREEKRLQWELVPPGWRWRCTLSTTLVGACVWRLDVGGAFIFFPRTHWLWVADKRGRGVIRRINSLALICGSDTVHTFHTLGCPSRHLPSRPL